MSDQNRIVTPGMKPGGDDAVAIGMTHTDGMVQITFTPAIVRMRMRPREARALAISIMVHADQAEYPQPPSKGADE